MLDSVSTNIKEPIVINSDICLHEDSESNNSPIIKNRFFNLNFLLLNNKISIIDNIYAKKKGALYNAVG